MKPSELVDKMKTALHARADVNNDGKLSRADVELVARSLAAQADAQTQKHPWGAVTVAAVVAACLGYAVRALFGC